MGKRGPRPTSTVKLRLRGSWRGKTVARKNEVKPKSAVPNPPAAMSKEAKAEWKRVVKELDALGLIAKIDRAALTILCNAWGDYVEARAKLKNPTDRIYENEKGEIKPHPFVKIQNDAAALWHRMCKEFGLAPASRAGLQPTGKPKAIDPLDALVNRKKLRVRAS